MSIHYSSAICSVVHNTKIRKMSLKKREANHFIISWQLQVGCLIDWFYLSLEIPCGVGTDYSNYSI